MKYAVYAIAALWGCVALYLSVRLANCQRLMMNNVAPGLDASQSQRLFLRGAKVDLAQFLNADGLRALAQSRRLNRLFTVWIIGGGALLAAGLWLTN